MSVYQVKWTALDIAHWQKRIENSYHQILKIYPTGCLCWLKEFEPGRVAALKATVQEIKLAYAKRDAQSLDAALTYYRDSHMKAFEEYLAKSSNLP